MASSRRAPVASGPALHRIAALLLVLIGRLSEARGEELMIENLGPVERQARIRGHAVSPGTKNYPPRLLIGFVDGDGTWIVNLEDGTSRKADAAGFENDYLQWPTMIGADGKLFSSCGAGGLSVYDPVTDSIEYHRPIPAARWLRGLAIGPEGMVFVSDYPSGSAARFDPSTGKMTNLGPQGGPFQTKNIYGYSVGCDGRFVYTAAGKMPWQVVACELQSATQTTLFEYPTTDYPEIHQRGDEVFLEVKLESPDNGQPAEQFFRLHHGTAEAVDTIPRYDDSHVPGVDLPQPEIQEIGRTLAVDADGAALRYRPADDTAPGTWRRASIPVTGQDMSIERISALADGRLLIFTGPYGNVHTFDPRSGEYAPIGNPASKNVYDLQEFDGTVYFCGYPNSVLGVFEGGDARLIGDWHESLNSKHALFLLRGADGRIYSGNHNERESTGGALGWFDPATQSFGGIHFPNDDCEYLTAADGGRYIVYASDFSADPAHPEITARDGRLIIYDTQSGKVVRQFSPLSDGSAGVIVEAAPGKLFGLGLHDKLPVMYRVDLDSGSVEKRVALPAKAIRQIALGPDRQVYFFCNDSLLRADPETFETETLCSATPGRMLFLGDDLYLAGTSQLRRIKGVAAGRAE